ncbi:MAG TPA: hypothetical protein PLE30_01805 [Candidatus Kapabacteria bacterium]|nr:hypothetical protein [Candidatus Kapabacteria bacterium]
MQDSNTIRPEIRGLFEVVKQQSKQYMEAFEQLENQKLEYQHIINDINNLADSLTLKINHEIFSFKQKYEDLSKILTIETNKTLDKYKEIADLAQLQTSYSKALESITLIKGSIEKNTLQLQKESEEYIREFNFLKNNTNKEINLILSDKEELIRRISKEEIAIWSNEINTQFKSASTRLNKLEQSFSLSNSQLSNDFKRLYKDLDNIKSLVKNFNKKDIEENKHRLDSVEQNLSKYDQSLASLSSDFYHFKIKNESPLAPIQSLENEIKETMKPVQSSVDNSITAFFGKDYEDEHKKLLLRLNKTESALGELQSKYNSAQLIAIGSIIIAILSIAIAIAI